MIDTVLIYVLLGVGLNMVVGYAGLLDLGYVAFYAIGAYSYAILASDQFDIHLPFEFILVIGGCLAGLAGVLLGIPVLRLRGDYLAMVTLGFGEIIRLLLNNQVWLTNGPQGIARIDEPFLLGFGLNTPKDFFWLLLPLVVVALTLAWRLEQSILGLGWAAIREDQDAARGIGIDTTVAKLLAFGLSATLGGFAGVVFAAFQRFVDPVSFSFWESLTIVLIIVIGGLGNLVGVVVGATVLIVVPELLRGYSEYRMLLYGCALVAMILIRPRGLIDRRYNPGLADAGCSAGDDAQPRGGHQAVRRARRQRSRLRFEFRPGRITSVIGPNGAGKSTLINLCAGSYRVTSGRILLDQLELQQAKKHEIARRRCRANLSEHPALRRHDGAAESGGLPVSGIRRADVRRGLPAATVAADEARADGALHGRARTLRPCIGMPAIRRRPVIRQPEAPRDRAGDRVAAESPDAGRACRRVESRRDTPS